MPVLRLHLPDDAATRAVGAALAPCVDQGWVVYLSGDLGAGKTTVVRGLLAALGHRGKVKSPTFSLVEPYVFSRLDCYHFDLYRLQNPAGWDDAGFRDYFAGRALCLIEWPERAAGRLPPPDLWIRLSIADGGREVALEAHTPLGERCIQQLEHSLPPIVRRAS
jgi:tRNA threonylcarbamoyladenosine biosynthesis protein TsaE